MQDKKMNYRKIIIWTSIAVLVFWGFSFVLLNWSESTRGTFGDMFGAVNALFSGLAFAGIIITIYMQREELALQRKELKETKGVFEKQSKIMADQQNDNAFFNLLANHRQMVESLKRGRLIFKGRKLKNPITDTEIVSGYELIDEIATRWFDHFQTYSKMVTSKVIWNLGDGTVHPFDLVHDTPEIFSYFREVEHIKVFITERFENTDQRKFYEETLWNSLLLSEKFVFETILFNSDEKHSYEHAFQVYNANEELVDFNQSAIPWIEAEYSYDRDEDGYHPFVEFKTDGNIVNYFLVVTERNGESKQLHSLKMELDKGSNLTHLRLGLNELIINSKVGIEKLPTSENNELRRAIDDHNIYVVLMIEYMDHRYKVPVGLSLRIDTDWASLSYVNYDGNNNVNNLSEERALRLCETLSP